MRVLLHGEQPGEVDDVDDPYREVGQVAAEQLGGGQHFQGGDVARAGEHHVGLAGSVSVPAQSQMPAPRAQCARATSRSSQSKHGCLPATTTLT